MKIAIIRPFPNVLSLSGYNVQEFGLAQALGRAGVEVDVFCAGHGATVQRQSLFQSDTAQVHVVWLPYQSRCYTHGIFPDLLKELGKSSYTLFQVQGFEQYTSYRVIKYATALKRPAVIHEGLYEGDFGRIINGLQWAFRKTYGRYMIEHAAGCIAKTALAKAALVKKNFSEKQIQTIPIGLNTSAFKTETAVDWRTRLSIPLHAKVLLYIGIIETRRNVDFLVRLTAQLLSAHQGVYLVIVGEGPEKQKCQALAQQLSIQNNVRFAGRTPQDQLPDLYRTADLFLLPSDSEIVGMVLLESLYFKLPVATTSTAGALDIISPEHGFIFNGLDLQHWTDALLRFLANNTHRAFRQAMRAFAFDRDWDSLAGRYIDFYQQVCSASGLTPNSKKAEGVLNAPE